MIKNKQTKQKHKNLQLELSKNSEPHTQLGLLENETDKYRVLDLL